MGRGGCPASNSGAEGGDQFGEKTISSLNEQLQKTQQYNIELVSEVDELLDAAKNNGARRPSEDSLAQVESDWTKKLAAKDVEIKDVLVKIMRLEERSQIQLSPSPSAGDSSDALAEYGETVATRC